MGGGHAHEDKLHVDLFYRGEDIVRDSGRLTYVDKPERYELKAQEGAQCHRAGQSAVNSLQAFLGIS